MIGTRVVRGPDWFLNGSLEDEDGGEGNVGTIISIVEYNSRAFQEVKVLWDTGETSICRCGPKGYQDLRVSFKCSKIPILENLYLVFFVSYIRWWTSISCL